MAAHILQGVVDRSGGPGDAAVGIHAAGGDFFIPFLHGEGELARDDGPSGQLLADFRCPGAFLFIFIGKTLVGLALGGSRNEFLAVCRHRVGIDDACDRQLVGRRILRYRDRCGLGDIVIGPARRLRIGYQLLDGKGIGSGAVNPDSREASCRAALARGLASSDLDGDGLDRILRRILRRQKGAVQSLEFRLCDGAAAQRRDIRQSGFELKGEFLFGFRLYHLLDIQRYFHFGGVQDVKGQIMRNHSVVFVLRLADDNIRGRLSVDQRRGARSCHRDGDRLLQKEVALRGLRLRQPVFPDDQSAEVGLAVCAGRNGLQRVRPIGDLAVIGQRYAVRAGRIELELRPLQRLNGILILLDKPDAISDQAVEDGIVAVLNRIGECAGAGFARGSGARFRDRDRERRLRLARCRFADDHPVHGVVVPVAITVVTCIGLDHIILSDAHSFKVHNAGPFFSGVGIDALSGDCRIGRRERVSIGVCLRLPGIGVKVLFGIDFKRCAVEDTAVVDRESTRILRGRHDDFAELVQLDVQRLEFVLNRNGEFAVLIIFRGRRDGDPCSLSGFHRYLRDGLFVLLFIGNRDLEEVFRQSVTLRSLGLLQVIHTRLEIAQFNGTKRGFSTRGNKLLVHQRSCTLLQLRLPVDGLHGILAIELELRAGEQLVPLPDLLDLNGDVEDLRDLDRVLPGFRSRIDDRFRFQYILNRRLGVPFSLDRLVHMLHKDFDGILLVVACIRGRVRPLQGIHVFLRLGERENNRVLPAIDGEGITLCRQCFARVVLRLRERIRSDRIEGDLHINRFVFRRCRGGVGRQ